MQSQRHETDLISELDAYPGLSQPPNPDIGLGGSAEGG